MCSFPWGTRTAAGGISGAYRAPPDPSRPRGHRVPCPAGIWSDAARWFHATNSPDGLEFATFEGHDALVVFNRDNPEVAEHVVRVMRRWLDRGADAWRLDAAYAVPTRFWAAVLP